MVLWIRRIVRILIFGWTIPFIWFFMLFIGFLFTTDDPEGIIDFCIDATKSILIIE